MWLYEESDESKVTPRLRPGASGVIDEELMGSLWKGLLDMLFEAKENTFGFGGVKQMIGEYNHLEKSLTTSSRKTLGKNDT